MTRPLEYVKYLGKRPRVLKKFISDFSEFFQ